MPSSSWERVPEDAGPEVLWDGAEWARGPQTCARQEQTGRGQIQALPYCRSQSSPPRAAKALCPKGWPQEGDPEAGGGEIPLTLRQLLSRPFSVGIQAYMHKVLEKQLDMCFQSGSPLTTQGRQTPTLPHREGSPGWGDPSGVHPGSCPVQGPILRLSVRFPHDIPPWPLSCPQD